MASFLLDLLSDLTLSGIAYLTLAATLTQALQLITDSLSPDWTLPQPATFDIPYSSLLFSIAITAWITRFLLRCGGHFACAGQSFAYILRWLSPLHPDPLKTCPCYCSMREQGEPATARLQEGQGKVCRPYPLPSPAPTLEGEERCIAFAVASQVSDEGILDEWRDVDVDVGGFEDKEGMEEGVSGAAGSSVHADEGTSGWRDLACCSDREGTEDTAVRTN